MRVNTVMQSYATRVCVCECECEYVLDGNLEGIEGVAELFVEGPAKLFVQIVQLAVLCLSYVLHNAVYL